MLVEEFFDATPGYHPLLITKHWQVAQLNDSKEQRPEAIWTLEMHENTDETFTLLKGKAFLIVKHTEAEDLELLHLKKGYTYNVPSKVWHNIAMQAGSSVLITENAQTHKEPKKNIQISETDREKVIAFGQEKII